MIDKNELINEFITLASFNSLSYEELDISLYLKKRLENLGFSVIVDDAGKKLNNNPKATGNIYGFLKGNIEGKSICFSSHMDTVSPGINKKVIVDNDIIKSDGNTILGADDINGILSIIKALDIIKKNNLRHPDIEVVFFIAEEAFCMGSRLFDFNLIKSKYAYVFDLSGEIGLAAYKAPSIISFEIEILGKAAHAGFEIDKGISSILYAAKKISKLNVGKIDDETTMNIGLIEGGSGKNIVPYKTKIEGEIRSFKHEKALKVLNEIKEIFLSDSKKENIIINFKYDENIFAYEVEKNSYVINRYKKALDDLNYNNFKLIETFGGSDNNNFNKHNIEGIVVANAMNNIHTTNEYYDINDLIKSINIALKLMTIGE